MPTFQKVRIFALALLVAGFIGLGAVHPVSADAPTDAQQIDKLCSQKLNVPDNTANQKIEGCAYGYNLALNGQNVTGCSKTYSDADNAAQDACKNVGYKLGQKNPLNLKAPKDDQGKVNKNNGSSDCTASDCDLINLYINPAIRILSAIVGVIAAASLVAAGIQYMTSTGDPQKVGAAKSRISTTLMALIFYILLYAFLNFLVPGGIF